MGTSEVSVDVGHTAEIPARSVVGELTVPADAFENFAVESSDARHSAKSPALSDGGALSTPADAIESFALETIDAGVIPSTMDDSRCIQVGRAIVLV